MYNSVPDIKDVDVVRDVCRTHTSQHMHESTSAHMHILNQSAQIPHFPLWLFEPPHDHQVDLICAGSARQERERKAE